MSDVQSLMNEIKNFDSEPSIFTVSLVAADHRSGFAANVVFRSNVEGAASYLEAHGNTPEEALSILLNTLKAKWGKCPHCGNYSHGAVQQGVERTVAQPCAKHNMEYCVECYPVISVDFNRRSR